MPTQSKTRKYEKRRRAESEAATKRRITEAAVDLHGTIGPKRTTIKALAEAAGVQRATVYRHFPDLESLFDACSAHWFSLNPAPDAAAWAEISNPDERLRRGLADLYDWYGWAEPMMTNILRDAPHVPEMQTRREAFQARFHAYVETLIRGRAERGRARGRVTAAITHATSFPTWLSLTRQNGLSDAEAIDLMAGMVAAAAR
jgi:AcrR family transcriptional regulator